MYLQVIWTLQPTSGELQIEIIKEALEVVSDSKEVQSSEDCSTSTSSNVSYAFLVFIFSWCIKV